MSASNPTRRSLLALAPAAIGLVAGCSSQPASMASEAPRPRMTDRLPDLDLIDHRGRPARAYSDLIADRPVVINFMYVKCQGSCPAAVALLRRLRPEIGRVLGPQARLLSFTLDPDSDTPGALAEYARSNAPEGPGLCDWRFLTGRPDDLLALRRALGYWDPDPKVDGDRTQHAALLTFGNDRLDRWAALPVGIPERQMLRTIERIAAPRGLVNG